MLRKQKYDVYILYIIAPTIVLIFIVTSLLSSAAEQEIIPDLPFDKNFNENEIQTEAVSPFNLAKTKFKICMKNAASNNYNNSKAFFGDLPRCIKTYLPINEMQMDNFSNDKIAKEKKTFMPMTKHYMQEKCKWLTIGIDGSSTAEEEFHKMYPQCSIFGAEPGDAGNFSDTGKIFPFGIGIEDGEIELSSIRKKKQEIKTKKVISFIRLIDEYIHSRLIHYMVIDTGGYEHTILQELVGNGKFIINNITICQINAELHFEDTNQVEFLLNFLNDSSPYLPISVVPYQKNRHPHQRITFIETENKECQTAFKFRENFDPK